jgi:hypothetical protein
MRKKKKRNLKYETGSVYISQKLSNNPNTVQSFVKSYRRSKRRCYRRSCILSRIYITRNEIYFRHFNSYYFTRYMSSFWKINRKMPIIFSDESLVEVIIKNIHFALKLIVYIYKHGCYSLITILGTESKFLWKCQYFFIA